MILEEQILKDIIVVLPVKDQDELHLKMFFKDGQETVSLHEALEFAKWRHQNYMAIRQALWRLIGNREITHGGRLDEIKVVKDSAMELIE
jgi:hypothetical protein